MTIATLTNDSIGRLTNISTEAKESSTSWVLNDSGAVWSTLSCFADLIGSGVLRAAARFS
jgi:hypothetical protein